MANKTNKDIIEDFRKGGGRGLAGKAYWDRLLPLFSPGFADSPDTLVIIDEIQDSEFFYNSIRDMRSNCVFHLLVTGSYLGVTLGNREFFDPSTDVHKILVPPLTFQEYLKNIGEHGRYMSLDLFGGSPHEGYHAINGHYMAYLESGGYPEAVSASLEAGSPAAAGAVLEDICSSTILECAKYMRTVEMPRFRSISDEVPRHIMSEKKGRATDFRNFVDDDGKFDWQSVEAVVNWLSLCRVIGFCGRAVDCDLRNIIYNSRIYYTDIGIATHSLRKAKGIDARNASGAIAENFAYIELDRLDPSIHITHQSPCFGTYMNGEIDFLVFSHATACTFGIDVKSGKGQSRTGIRLLGDGIIDYLVYARPGSTGGVGGPGTLTVPIYLLGRLDFDAIHPNKSRKATKARQGQMEYERELLDGGDGLLPPKQPPPLFANLGLWLREAFSPKLSR
jgi:predicted AAA+ superfamily ATPase